MAKNRLSRGLFKAGLKKRLTHVGRRVEIQSINRKCPEANLRNRQQIWQQQLVAKNNDNRRNVNGNSLYKMENIF